MARIDIENFIYYLTEYSKGATLSLINDALKNQGLEYKEGKFVEITIHATEDEIPHEPKFKVGDWIIADSDNVSPDYHICKVTKVKNGRYYIESIYGYRGYNTFEIFDEDYRLWTIQDAKNGDVLSASGFSDDCIFIFNGLDRWKFDEPDGERTVATGYCCITLSSDKIEFGYGGPDYIETNTVKPATKEQRELLFQKMAEAGYKSDAEKKELKKIQESKHPADGLPIEEPKEKLTEFETKVRDLLGYKSTFSKQDVKEEAQILLSLAHKQIAVEDEHWQDVRERAAIAAMQGILSAPIVEGIDPNPSQKQVARWAVKQADALIESLKKI